MCQHRGGGQLHLVEHDATNHTEADEKRLENREDAHDGPVLHCSIEQTLLANDGADHARDESIRREVDELVVALESRDEGLGSASRKDDRARADGPCTAGILVRIGPAFCLFVLVMGLVTNEHADPLAAPTLLPSSRTDQGGIGTEAL